jgi:DNA polymerase-1
MTQNKKLLLVLDSSALIHRAYHAVPAWTNKNGEQINAVYGFLLTFFRIIRELNPSFVVAAFDFPAPTFRHIKFKKYKAQRPKTPAELIEQFPKIKKILKSFEVPIFEEKGFEADDIIGTISKLAQQKKNGKGDEIETIIATGDMDALQLVNANTKVYSLNGGAIIYDEKEVMKRYEGLLPEQLLDFKALMGDPSDNIPGVAGVGKKTACMLINKFGSLDNVYKEVKANTQGFEKNENKNIKEIGVSERIKNKLLDDIDSAFLSKELACIKCDMGINLDFEKSKWKEYNKEEVEAILRDWGLYGLIKKLPNIEEEKQEKIELRLF